MDRFDMAVLMALDCTMETLPAGIDYVIVREIMRDQIRKAIQNTRDKMEGKE